jgi:hypothetical protein
MDGNDKYEVFLRVSDSSDDQHLYLVEHWFADRPGVETIKALLDEARRDYAVLYPDAHADDYSVEIRRLRPRDLERPEGAGRSAAA